MKKKPIVKIEEIGYPKSLVIRDGSRVSELIWTSQLEKEINHMIKRRLFIVGYSGGDESGYWRHEIFATDNELLAEVYVKRFNEILKKWKDYYDSICVDGEFGYRTLPEESNLTHRYYQVMDVEECYYKEIDFRN